MSDRTDIRQRARTAQGWLMDAFLPLWGGEGMDPRGVFVEALSLDGKMITTDAVRTRLQARQTYCFANAIELGLPSGIGKLYVDQGVDVLYNHCRRPDGLYGRTIKPGNGFEDDRVDLYDCAFALFAFASAYHATDSSVAKRAGQELINALQTQLKRPFDTDRNALMGYGETLPLPDRREQNPHMHLAEAFIAWGEATNSTDSIDHADAIVAFLERFKHARTGALEELLSETGEALPENRIEAGHQYEWVWLLGELKRVGGKPPRGLSKQLYEQALRLTSETGRIPLAHAREGDVLEPIHRTWLQTEALKAHIARASDGDKSALKRIAPTFDILVADHLTDCALGGWMDVRDDALRPLSTQMPASTGYHISLAFTELVKFAEALR